MADIEQEARVEAVRTGAPEVQLLACTECGVLLWDIDAHYRQAHPPARMQGEALGPAPAPATNDERVAREAAYQEAKLANPHWMISEHGAFEAGWNARAGWRPDPAPATRETVTEGMVRAGAYVLDEAAMDSPEDYPFSYEQAMQQSRDVLEAALGAEKGDES